jgi:hypothetical protein
MLFFGWLLAGGVEIAQANSGDAQEHHNNSECQEPSSTG